MEVESNFLNDSVGTNGWKVTGNRCRPKKTGGKKPPPTLLPVKTVSWSEPTATEAPVGL